MGEDNQGRGQDFRGYLQPLGARQIVTLDYVVQPFFEYSILSANN